MEGNGVEKVVNVLNSIQHNSNSTADCYFVGNNTVLSYRGLLRVLAENDISVEYNKDCIKICNGDSEDYMTTVKLSVGTNTMPTQEFYHTVLMSKLNERKLYADNSLKNLLSINKSQIMKKLALRNCLLEIVKLKVA